MYVECRGPAGVDDVEALGPYQRGAVVVHVRDCDGRWMQRERSGADGVEGNLIEGGVAMLVPGADGEAVLGVGLKSGHGVAGGADVSADARSGELAGDVLLVGVAGAEGAEASAADAELKVGEGRSGWCCPRRGGPACAVGRCCRAGSW